MVKTYRRVVMLVPVLVLGATAAAHAQASRAGIVCDTSGACFPA